jgi:hypothetical protein
MKPAWFREWGPVYYPVTWQGWLLSALAVLFLVHIFLAVDHRSHSVSDTLYGIFPYWVPTLLGWLWIAGKTSGK